jgi:hypothetical protein
MYGRLPSAPEPLTWPGSAGSVPPLADDSAASRAAAVASIVAVAADTRRLTNASAGLLAGVLVGSATVAAALAARGRQPEIGSMALLAPVIICWLGAAALVLLSEWPVSSALAKLRQASGAPVDLSAPWSPMGVRPLDDSEVTWPYVVPLIAAVALRHARSRRALFAAVLTAAAFLSWMSLSLAAVILA